MSTTSPDPSEEAIRTAVREHYGALVDTAPATSGCCAPAAEVAPESAGSCCGPGPQPVSLALGYTPDDLAAVPEGADLGLGCGNPHALARINPGMTVLDLGSGAGFDAFLAARAVGPTGRVIGVDMTPAMLTRARTNASSVGYDNVEFRLGEIEHLPVADASVDVVISNCVINLSPDKQQVFDEAFRVLRPGGRLAVSDVVAFADLPADIRGDLALHSGCVAGAATVTEVQAMLERAGFADIRVTPVDESREVIDTWAPGRNVGDFVVSASIEGTRPAAP